MTRSGAADTTTATGVSGSFTLLHPHVQQRVWQWGWTELRRAQEQAIPLLVAGGEDVIVSAATASGKTEAAFLPIVSNLLQEPPRLPGAAVLYLAPLKALLNDQVVRQRDLCDGTSVAVHIRHGDIADREKKKWLDAPSGILMTTPESLEALFARRGTAIPRLFAALRYIVVDELHAFIGTERGAQLQSLLNRLEEATSSRPARVGLSATLGDLGMVARQLTPGNPGRVHLIRADQVKPNVTVQLHGIREGERGATGLGTTAPTALRLICDDLMMRLADGHHLVFLNSRQAVETVADTLAGQANKSRRVNPFHPHHGSLSAQLRERAEAALKNPHAPATAVATTTLEMGLDVGSVQTVTQIGAAPGVANLRQRLGRSGRRGQPAELTVYCPESDLSPRSSLDQQLRSGLTQSIAMIDLLMQGWCEDPPRAQLHTSTLVQQLLSAIAERGGMSPRSAFDLLCWHEGPFGETDTDRFRRLLRVLLDRGVLERTEDLLSLGPEGEKLVNHHEFFAAFNTPREYRFMAKAQLIGKRAMVTPTRVDDLIVLGARRWKVVQIDHQAGRVDLKPSPVGRAPSFGGDVPPVHDIVRREMRRLLAGTTARDYLDDEGRSLLDEARSTFAQYALGGHGLLDLGPKSLLVPWVGTRTAHTLELLLQSVGVKTSADGLTLMCEAEAPEVLEALEKLATSGPADARTLADLASAIRVNKHDKWLTDDLLRDDYAARDIDVAAAHAAILRILQEEQTVVAGAPSSRRASSRRQSASVAE